MRVCVSQVIDRNHGRLYLIVNRLQKQWYLIYDVVMNIVEELFEDECGWTKFFDNFCYCNLKAYFDILQAICDTILSM